MDSNFQVKITADLSDLQARIKSVEGTLNSLQAVSTNATKKLQVGMDNAAVSVERLNNNANRGRLAAFAFGQVIRDAGFFSQNFGLGVLAISNNIPILIDQLVLLTGITGAAGIAISLLGSFLTAGLTIFAYWAQSVQSDGKSVGQEIQKMALDSQTYIGQLVDYLSKPPASTLLNTIIGGFREGFELLKQIAKAGIEFIIAVWDKFGTEISMVMDWIYQIVYNQMNNALNIIKLVTGLIKGDWETVWEAIKQITFNVINNIISAMQTLLVGVSTLIGGLVGTTNAAAGASITAAGQFIAKLGDKLKIAKKDTNDFNFVFKDFIRGLTFAAPATKGASDGLGKIGKETLIVDKRLNDVTDTLNKYYDKLKDIELTPGISKFDIKKQSVEALGDLIVNLRKIPGTERTVGLLTTEFNKLNKALEVSKDVDVISFEESQFRDALNAFDELKKARDGYFDPTETQNLKNDLMQSLYPSDAEKFMTAWGMIAQGISDILGNTFVDLGNLIAGSIGGEEFWGNILKSVGGFLSALGKQLIAFGVGMKIYAIALAALQSGNPVLIAASAGGLIIAGAVLATVGGIISGLAGGKKQKNGGDSGSNATSGNYGRVRPFAAGGIVSGPTNALIGEYPGAKANPEVVAPLDKLTNLIGGSIGGGDMGGQLTARISGNDLVILLDRASKNRKNYF